MCSTISSITYRILFLVQDFNSFSIHVFIHYVCFLVRNEEKIETTIRRISYAPWQIFPLESDNDDADILTLTLKIWQIIAGSMIVKKEQVSIYSLPPS